MARAVVQPTTTRVSSVSSSSSTVAVRVPWLLGLGVWIRHGQSQSIVQTHRMCLSQPSFRVETKQRTRPIDVTWGRKLPIYSPRASQAPQAFTRSPRPICRHAVLPASASKLGLVCGVIPRLVVALLWLYPSMLADEATLYPQLTAFAR